MVQEEHQMLEVGCEPSRKKLVPGEERETWVGKLDFVLSCIGYGVGIGDLLRFPYIFIKNGGGAFLIPFFVFMVLCGFPLFYLEVAIGQFSSLSCLAVWKICPLLKGIGYGMVIVSGILSLYYIMMIVWTMYFLVMSCMPELPWASCDNHFNTDSCILSRRKNDSIMMFSSMTFNSSLSNVTLSTSLPPVITTGTLYNSSSSAASATVKLPVYKTAAEEFWEHGVLELSSGIHDIGYPRWQLVLCLFFCWGIVFLCLVKGIRTSGRVVYVTVLAPYVLLTIFLVRAATLPGAGAGVLYFLTPEWSRLLDIQVWLEAAIQVFFSLGPAWGGLITMSSYNKFKHNCFRDAVVTTAADIFTGLFGGLVISCVLGFMAYEAGKDISEVVISDPGVALVVYPETISKLPVSQLWAFLFFLTLIFLGLDSEFGMFESLCSGICDEFPRYFKGRKTLVTGVLAIFAFLLGLPFTTQGGMYVYQILDWYAGTFCVLTIALLECVIVGWIYGAGYFSEDIRLMSGKRPSLFLRLCWVIITPALLLGALIFTVVMYGPPTLGDYHYPSWAITIGVMISLVSLIPIPTVLVWNLIKAKGNLCQRIKFLLKPDKTWGPMTEKTRERHVEARNQLRDTGWAFRLLGLTSDREQEGVESQPALAAVS